MSVVRYFRVRKVAGVVGIEIEVEGNNLPKDHTLDWHVEHDGSLRGNDNAEYVLNGPMTLVKAKDALNNLNKKFELHGAEVDLSRRTSTHVHINCTELEMLTLFNFLMLLFIFEELLVNWCNKSRHGNLFCLQSKDAEGVLHTLRTFAKTGDKALLRDNIRYSVINLAALRKYGSVEIRVLEGTVDADRIMTWVKTLYRIREAAKKYNNPQEIIEDMSKLEPAGFAKKILGPSAPNFFRGKGRKRRLIDGVRRAQDIAYAVMDWEKEWGNINERGYRKPIEDPFEKLVRRAPPPILPDRVVFEKELAAAPVMEHPVDDGF